MFEKQADVHRAIERGEKRIAACCSRRSGKSYFGNTEMAHCSTVVKDAQCLYLALTHDNVRRISWPTIHRLDRQYELGIKFNEAFLWARFPYTRGLIEYCGIGAAKTGEIADRFRGAAEGYNVVVVDEASKFPPAVLDYLIEEVIEPALMDREGLLILTGTPTPNASGTFYKATTTGLAGWTAFHWIAKDNPHVAAQWAKAVEEKRKQNPNIDQVASFRREYFGEWVVDASDLVYQLDEENLVDIAPLADGTWSYVIGVDLGWNDSTAISVVGWQSGRQDLWVLESQKARRLLPDEIARRIDEVRTRFPNAPIVIDTGHASQAQRSVLGGHGRTIAQELGYRYGISTIPTDRSDKNTWIALVNSDMKLRRIHIVRSKNLQLLDEMRALAWEQKAIAERGDDESTQSTNRETPGMPNDCCDAMLYAYRYAYGYLERPIEFATKTEQEKIFERHVLKRGRSRFS